MATPERFALVLYADPAHPVHRRIESGLRALAPRRTLETHRTVADLAGWMRRPGSLRTHLMVLCPGSAADLDDLKEIRPLLVSTHRLVFVLPDRSEKTIAAGHAFYPRYIAFADDDPEDVLAVLGRLVDPRFESPVHSHENRSPETNREHPTVAANDRISAETSIARSSSHNNPPGE